MDHSIIILGAQQLLGIKKPVDIRITTANPSKSKKDFAGLYEGRYRKDNLIRHVIYINIRVVIEAGFSLTDVIAHEMVHAAQFEYGIFNNEKHHDKKFQKMCEYLENEFLKLGVTLGKLYSPESDTD